MKAAFTRAVCWGLLELLLHNQYRDEGCCLQLAACYGLPRYEGQGTLVLVAVECSISVEPKLIFAWTDHAFRLRH